MAIYAKISNIFQIMKRCLILFSKCLLQNHTIFLKHMLISFAISKFCEKILMVLKIGLKILYENSMVFPESQPICLNVDDHSIESARNKTSRIRNHGAATKRERRQSRREKSAILSES
jgi:hypothetical protein